MLALHERKKENVQKRKRQSHAYAAAFFAPFGELYDFTAFCKKRREYALKLMQLYYIMWEMTPASIGGG